MSELSIILKKLEEIDKKLEALDLRRALEDKYKEKDFLTLEETAEYTRHPYKTIQHYMRNGTLRIYNDTTKEGEYTYSGRKPLFLREKLYEWRLRNAKREISKEDTTVKIRTARGGVAILKNMEDR